MKKFLDILLAAAMLLAVAVSTLAEGEVFLWDNFDDRDPNSKPELAPNGMNIWWDNWANLRARNEDGAIRIDYRPVEYDPEDDLYESEDDYYAHAGDWMGNWGEAVNMWSVEGISWCKYLTIRIKGEEGGEEKKLIMDWHPEDSKFFAARFADLVLADGTNPVITTEWQDLVIDLEASGFPGMTNAFHIRAFAKCVIWLDEISFSEAVAPIDAASAETILAGITVEETGKPGDLPIKDFAAALEGAADAAPAGDLITVSEFIASAENPFAWGMASISVSADAETFGMTLTKDDGDIAITATRTGAGTWSLDDGNALTGTLIIYAGMAMVTVEGPFGTLSYTGTVE